MKRFWILWNPKGNTPPTVRFNTYEKALETGQMMQERIGVGTMYVMKVEAEYTVMMHGKTSTKFEDPKAAK